MKRMKIMAIKEEVSGIGPMSKRTDLNVSKQPARYISGMPYGEGQATYEQQRAAPMMGTSLPSELSALTSLTALTERPSEPITSGINMGPGPGSEALASMPTRPTISLIDTFKQLSQFDASGDAELIYNRLISEGY